MTTKLLEKALKSAGGLRELRRRVAQSARNLAFIDEKKDELLKLYDENWVAVYNSEIVAHEKNFKNLINKLNKAGLPFDEVTIEFMSSRKELTLF